MIAAYILVLYLGVGYGYDSEKLKEKYSWKSLDFAYASDDARKEALTKKTFIPENNLPTGIAISEDKIFVSIPRRSPGVPATLAYFTKKCTEKSPKLIPYPSFQDNEFGDGMCDNLISVNRGMRCDILGRLWVVDSGKTGMGKDAKQICPPRIHIFDLNTNKKLRMYTLKKTHYTASSIFVSATIEVGKGSKDDYYLYFTDQNALICYSWKKNDAWRFEHPYFRADPIATDYTFSDINFQWSESGIFTVALSPVQKDGFRTAYFHPLSSNYEFSVSTKTLHDNTKVKDNYHDFKIVGSRGKLGRSTTEVMDKTGVLFFNLIDQNATACWNTEQPYDPENNIAIIAKDDKKMVFPTASVIDGSQNLWILSNKFPFWKYGKLDYKQYNFHIFTAPVEELKAGTPCALSSK